MTPGPILRRAAAAAAVALAALLAGCSASGNRLHDVQHYRPDPFGYLVAGGTESRAVATIVAGNPFGVRPDTLASVVAAGLQGAFPGSGVRFATRPENGVRRDVTMIVAFDPPPNIGPAHICARRGAVPTGGAGRAIDTVIAFCHADAAIAGIRGRLARGAGLGDPGFVGALRDMTRRLFQREYRS